MQRSHLPDAGGCGGNDWPQPIRRHDLSGPGRKEAAGGIVATDLDSISYVGGTTGNFSVSFSRRGRDAVAGSAVYRGHIHAAARSATANTVALVLAEGMIGITEASATRTPSTPLTRNAGSTTACSSVPMRQVPTGWK